MRIAVVGSRGFEDYKILKAVVDELRTIYDIKTIVSGGANGADSLAEQYAEENNLEMKVFPAKWKELGKKAGYVRNIEIWDDSDMGVAFWDGQSRGTAHSFDISKRQQKKLYVFNYSKMDFYLLNENIEETFFSIKDNVKYKINN
jgi:hypothetical protein